LDFAPIAGDPLEISRTLVDQGGGGSLYVFSVIAKLARKLVVPALLDVQAACADADAILSSFPMAIPGHTVARMLGVPDLFAHVYPICAPTAAFPSIAFPELPLGGVYNRFSHFALDQVIW